MAIAAGNLGPVNVRDDHNKPARVSLRFPPSLGVPPVVRLESRHLKTQSTNQYTTSTNSIAYTQYLTIR